MSFNETKFRKKLETQKRSNPGNKTSYENPWRGRSTVFKDKSKYDRNRVKNELRQMKGDM